MGQQVQSYQVNLHDLYLPLVLGVQVVHSDLDHPLVLGGLVFQSQVPLAFLVNQVVLDDLSHPACLVVQVDHFDLVFLARADQAGLVVLLHPVAHLVLSDLDALYLQEVLVGLASHSNLVFQNQVNLLAQEGPGVRADLYDLVALVVPFLYRLWVLVIQEVLAVLCGLALLSSLVGLAVPGYLVYLFQVAQVVLVDLDVLVVRMAPVRP